MRAYANLARPGIPAAIGRRGGRHRGTLADHVLGAAAARPATAPPPACSSARPPPGKGGCRRAPRPTTKLKVVIVDDGATGLSEKRRASRSRSNVVRGGDSGAVKRAQEPGSDGQEQGSPSSTRTRRPRAASARLGKSTFLVFLTPSTDPEHAIGLVAPHVDLDEEERKTQQKRFAKHIAGRRGGMNIDRIDGRKRSYGAALVSTTIATKMQEKEGAGAESAGNLVGETILHELGHAWGHQTELGDRPHQGRHHDRHPRARLLAALQGRPLQRGEREDHRRPAGGARKTARAAMSCARAAGL